MFLKVKYYTDSEETFGQLCRQLDVGSSPSSQSSAELKQSIQQKLAEIRALSITVDDQQTKWCPTPWSTALWFHVAAAACDYRDGGLLCCVVFCLLKVTHRESACSMVAGRGKHERDIWHHPRNSSLMGCLVNNNNSLIIFSFNTQSDIPRYDYWYSMNGW